MRIVSVSVTEAGRALAGRLPFEHVHGGLGETVRVRWGDVDGFVLFAAVGIAARVAGPLLDDKRTDPAVVCVDEAGRFAVAVAGGHAGGANRLAEEVAARLGATPVITTATDAAGVVALDALPGFVAAGDVAGVTRALLDGEPVGVMCELPDWPLPPALPSPRRGRTEILVTDRDVVDQPGVVVLHPPSLVVGMGASTGAPPDEAAALLAAALEAAGLSPASLAEVATLDRKAGEAAITALGLPIRAYPAPRLAAQPVPHPSTVVEQAVGTPTFQALLNNVLAYSH